MRDVPRIDTSVHRIGVSELRQRNARRLKEMSKENYIEVICNNNEPLAVLVPYPLYLDIQAELEKLIGGRTE